MFAVAVAVVLVLVMVVVMVLVVVFPCGPDDNDGLAYGSYSIA